MQSIAAAGGRSRCSTSRRRATLMEGEVPPQVGNDHPTSMPTSAYATADGYINVAAVGQGDVARRLRGDRPARPGRATREFKTAADRAKNRKALNAEHERDSLAAKTSDEWVDDPQQGGRALRPDLQHGPGVRRPAGAAHAGCAAEVKHRSSGEIRPRQPAGRLSRTPAKLVAATPERGEHTDEVLREMGFSDLTPASQDPLKQKGISDGRTQNLDRRRRRHGPVLQPGEDERHELRHVAWRCRRRSPNWTPIRRCA